jgi:hypothetical protein
MKKFFFGILKVSEERSRIRRWIRILQSEVRIRRSGSAPKCHVSPTLLKIFILRHTHTQSHILKILRLS